MRRLLSRVFMLCFLAVAVSCLMLPSVSSAEDIWVGGNDYYSYYLVSDQISIDKTQPNYRGGVVTVNNRTGKRERNLLYGFELRNGVVVGYSYSRTDGYWGFEGPISSADPMYNSVWQAMKPYLKQQGLSDVDSWN